MFGHHLGEQERSGEVVRKSEGIRGVGRKRMMMTVVVVDGMWVDGRGRGVSGRKAGCMGRIAYQVPVVRRVLGFVFRRTPAMKCRPGLRRARL